MLDKKRIVLVSFMLFSLFFGAGNLIFPPFLGQCSGNNVILAVLGFLITAVLLPVLGVIVVAKFDGLNKLASHVHPLFAIIYTILIYLSIGPGLGIPRAASVPFEMAIAPYLDSGANLHLWMLVYSLLFFACALWLTLSPNKLVDRIGKVLTPSLLILLFFLFVNFLFRGQVSFSEATADYQNPLMKGFLEGYLTMDTIAALNFGLVISITITSLGVKEKSQTVHYVKIAGLFAGLILSLVYIILAYMGAASSGVYDLGDNGATILRQVVYQLFSNEGAFLLALIFTLACLTTCVGLITSISQFFNSLNAKISYRTWVFIITGFSFIVANQGLNTILSISVPVLDAIYPISIVLIVLGLLHNYIKEMPLIYPVVIGFVALESILYVLNGLGLNLLNNYLVYLPLYSDGLGWVLIAGTTSLILVLYYKIKRYVCR